MIRDGDRRFHLLMAGALVLALALRLPTAWFEMFHHPDEVWQYLEPAHGIVTGRWVVSWEYRDGIRPWLIPTLLAAPMRLGRAIAPDAYLVPVRLALIAVSLSVVLFGGLIAARVSRLHGLVTAACLAASFELVYFAGRALSDSIALAAILPALWLMRRERERSRDWVIAGLLLGVAATIRFQLLPALGVAALLGARIDWRRWAALAGGGVAGLLLAGLPDIAHGSAPLLWMVRNVTANVVENRSGDYGVAPPWWYVVELFRIWGWAGLVLVPAIVAGTIRAPGLMAVALVNIAVHSLIGHKEYRFVLLSETLFLILAGIGFAMGLAAVPPRKRQLAGGLLALAWIGGSAAIATSPGGHAQWTFGQRTIRSLKAAAHAPGSCGLAVFGQRAVLMAAYTYYDRAVPIYAFRLPEDLAAAARAQDRFDVAIGPEAAMAAGGLAPRFRRAACYPTAQERTAGAPAARCLFVRAGGCTASAAAPFLIDATLKRTGE